MSKKKKKKKDGNKPEFRVGPSGLETRSGGTGWISLSALWSSTGHVSEDAAGLIGGVRKSPDKTWERRLSDFDDEDIP